MNIDTGPLNVGDRVRLSNGMHEGIIVRIEGQFGSIDWFFIVKWDNLLPKYQPFPIVVWDKI